MCARTNKKPQHRRRKRPHAPGPSGAQSSAGPEPRAGEQGASGSPYYHLPSAPPPPSSAAATPDGLLAIMNSRIGDTLKAPPGDLRLLLRGADSLIRAAVAGHRISGKGDQDAAARMLEALTHLSSEFGVDPTILPPDGPAAGRTTP